MVKVLENSSRLQFENRDKTLLQQNSTIHRETRRKCFHLIMSRHFHNSAIAMSTMQELIKQIMTAKPKFRLTF